MTTALPRLLPLLLALSGCHDGGQSSGIPPLPADLTPADANPASRSSQTLWDDLAGELGIGSNQASTPAALAGQLATPSSFLTADRAADYAALLGNVAKAYGSTAYATRCATIDGLTALGPAKTVDPVAGTAQDFPGANLYLMRYHLQADATGKAEDQTRSGLVVIPAAGAGTSVIAAYAHGGDFGLGYPEVAAAFGAFQANHVIVAPTYPGEALCKVATDSEARDCDDAGPLVPASGQALAYDTDVDELLGMYDCVTRASIGKADAPISDAGGLDTGKTLAKVLTPLVKRHGTGTFAQQPQGIIVGASRGGLVAELALAKTGAALAALGAAPNALGPAYLAPSYFSCAAIISAPASFAFAEFRLFLEQWVKGRLGDTTFAGFLGMSSLADLFDPYRAGDEDAATAALKIVQRDAMLTSPLIVAALRDWAKFTLGTANGGQGAWLRLHGIYDGVVPLSQAQGDFNVLLGAASNAALVNPADSSKAPGLAFTQREIDAKADYLSGGKLEKGLSQHLDKAFFDGTSLVKGDFISPKVTGQALPVAAAETAANGIAQQLFGASPSANQLVAARAYLLSGVLQPKVPPTPQDGTDAAGNAIINLAEELSPAQILGLWRQGSCAAALQ